MPREPKPWFRKDRDAWFVTIRGTRHNLGPNKKQAYARFYELIKEPEQPKSVPAAKSNDAFVVLADKYLEWTSIHRAGPTHEWYRYRIERFCQRYPELKTSDLKPYHVQQWVDSYPELSQTSRRNYIRSVKRCLEWARLQGYIAANPIDGIEVPSAERRELLITPSDFSEMLSFIPDPTLRELCQVTFDTGCRPQESLRLEAKHIDFSFDRWVFPIKASKGKRAPRIVYLTPFAMDVCKRLAVANPQGLLFRNREGNPWTVSSVNCAFKRLQKRMAKAAMKTAGTSEAAEIAAEHARSEHAAIPFATLPVNDQRAIKAAVLERFARKYSLYALRHGWATRALQSGLDALTVAILMGHSDPSTLSKVYQHLSHNPEHLLEQARKAQKMT